MSLQDNQVKVRFFHNVKNLQAVDIYMWENIIVENVSFSEMTGYFNIKSGHTKIIVKDTIEETILMEKNISIEKGCTIIISDNIYKYVDYQKQNDCLKQGDAYVRFINSIVGFNNVDVYINDIQIFSNIEVPKTGTPKYEIFHLGESVNILVVKNSSTQDIVYGPSPVYLINSGIYTMITSLVDTPTVLTPTVLTFKDNIGQCVCDLQNNFIVSKYMGKWYQIASIPQIYEIDCPRVTAQYTLLNSNIKVYNKCYSKEWVVNGSIIGFAQPTDICTPSALRVEFPINNNMVTPPGPNYLVHKTDYKNYAIVGSPNRSTLYILCRSPKMNHNQYKELLKESKHMGYNVDSLRINYHALKK